MAARGELLVFGCREDDLALLSEVLGPQGPELSSMDSSAELARLAVSRRPLAIVLGVGLSSIARLDLISVIHGVRSSLPVIVVAEEDSIDLERSARERSIFYYLVHPLELSEVQAVMADVLRYANH